MTTILSTHNVLRPTNLFTQATQRDVFVFVMCLMQCYRQIALCMPMTNKKYKWQWDNAIIHMFVPPVCIKKIAHITKQYYVEHYVCLILCYFFSNMWWTSVNSASNFYCICGVCDFCMTKTECVCRQQNRLRPRGICCCGRPEAWGGSNCQFPAKQLLLKTACYSRWNCFPVKSVKASHGH